MRAKHHAADIYGENAVEYRRVYLPEHARRADARVIDQHVQFRNRAEHGIDLGGIRYIGLQRVRLCACSRDLRDDGCRCDSICEVIDDDGSTIRRESQRDCPPDPAFCAGDKRCLSLQCLHEG